MKAVVILTVARVVEIVDKPDVDKDEALQLTKETIQSDPYLFVDTRVEQDKILGVDVSIFEIPNG